MGLRLGQCTRDVTYPPKFSQQSGLETLWNDGSQDPSWHMGVPAHRSSIGELPIREHGRGRQASVEDYAVTCPPWDLCMEAPGSRAALWWQQDHKASESASESEESVVAE